MATREHYYVALLRAINVGGNNLIRMDDLRRSFEDLGHTQVATYIQSGNVVFCAGKSSPATLTRAIEKALSKSFAYDSRVCILSADELKRVVAEAPKGFGKDPGRYRYDVVFVMNPMTVAEAMEQVSVKPGVDLAHAGPGALYFRRLVSKASQSHLAKLMQRPVYKHVTVRNWNTTMRLHSMITPELLKPGARGKL